MELHITDLQQRIRSAFKLGAMPHIVDDYVRVFMTLGLEAEDAGLLTGQITALLASTEDLEATEEEIKTLLRKTKVNRRRVRDLVQEKLGVQAEFLFGNISLYLGAAKGKKVFEFGFPYGRLTHLLRERLDLNIVGSTEPDNSCAAGVMINASQYMDDLKEATRLIKREGILVAVEPVLIHNTEFAWNSMLLNDYLFSRILQDVDTDLSDTYQTGNCWQQMFAELGWELVKKESLGNLKLFQEWHIMYVLRKK